MFLKKLNKSIHLPLPPPIDLFPHLSRPTMTGRKEGLKEFRILDEPKVILSGNKKSGKTKASGLEQSRRIDWRSKMSLTSKDSIQPHKHKPILRQRLYHGIQQIRMQDQIHLELAK